MKGFSSTSEDESPAPRVATGMVNGNGNYDGQRMTLARVTKYNARKIKKEETHVRWFDLASNQDDDQHNHRNHNNHSNQRNQDDLCSSVSTIDTMDPINSTNSTNDQSSNATVSMFTVQGMIIL